MVFEITHFKSDKNPTILEVNLSKESSALLLQLHTATPKCTPPLVQVCLVLMAETG